MNKLIKKSRGKKRRKREREKERRDSGSPPEGRGRILIYPSFQDKQLLLATVVFEIEFKLA